jgi:hypothetical protein
METEINYFAAIGYSLIGWFLQCVYYYFQFDTDDPFDKKKFWNRYDKYIVFGFAASITLALLGDFAWPTITSKFGFDVKYDERVNIFIGFFSVLIVLYLSRNAKKKLEE